MNTKRLKNGDMVRIMKGKDAGKQGKVLKVLFEANKVVVDGANLYKKHLKGDGRRKESSIVTIAKPLSISNVMLVCPSCGKASRIGLQNKDGRVVRVCKKCGKVIEVIKAAAKADKKEEKKTEKKETTKKKTATKSEKSEKKTTKTKK